MGAINIFDDTVITATTGAGIDISNSGIGSFTFGNLEVKWQMDESSGSKDATPSMGPPEPKGKLDGQTRATNLRGLSSEGLEGIVKSFGLSCDTCTNAGHWISRVRSGGVCILAQQPRRCLGVAQRGHGPAQPGPVVRQRLGRAVARAGPGREQHPL